MRRASTSGRRGNACRATCWCATGTTPSRCGAPGIASGSVGSSSSTRPSRLPTRGISTPRNRPSAPPTARGADRGTLARLARAGRHCAPGTTRRGARHRGQHRRRSRRRLAVRVTSQADGLSRPDPRRTLERRDHSFARHHQAGQQRSALAGVRSGLGVSLHGQGQRRDEGATAGRHCRGPSTSPGRLSSGSADAIASCWPRARRAKSPSQRWPEDSSASSGHRQTVSPAPKVVSSRIGTDNETS